MDSDPTRIVEALAASGELEAVSVDGSGHIRGEGTFGDQLVGFRIELRPPFPIARPKVFLSEPDQLGPLPHVDVDGELCYSNGEGVLLDWRRPESLVIECVRRAKIVLADGLCGANRSEYFEEYQAHWRQSPSVSVPSLVDPSDAVAEIEVLEMSDSRILVRNVGDFESFGAVSAPRSTTIRKALFIPLVDPAQMMPVRSVWAVRDLRDALWAGISPAEGERLRRLLRHRAGRRLTEYVVIQVPRPSGEPALVGIRFTNMGTVHPLLPKGTAEGVDRLDLVRWDRHFLMPRGGAASLLADKHVCVVGCGAVGARVVDELVHAGISSLLLVDPDDVASENTYRHLLGRAYWGKSKVKALAAWVSQNVPYVKVSPFQGRFDEVLEKVPATDIADLDLIVFATGCETADLQANAVLRGRRSPALLFTWLEPLGIGGHAVLQLPEMPGCVECLHTSGDGELQENRASFVAPNQRFALDLSGCGSAFTPFSNLHATQTAVLAAQLGLDYLQGSVSASCLRSWRGDSRMLIDAGFAPSARYLSDDDGRVLENFAAPACRVCGTASGAQDG